MRFSSEGADVRIDEAAPEPHARGRRISLCDMSRGRETFAASAAVVVDKFSGKWNEKACKILNYIVAKASVGREVAATRPCLKTKSVYWE